MPRILFLCSRNRWRSPTAEAVFAAYPGVETASAGLAPDAEHRVVSDDVDWADTIVVMERAHRKKLAAAFGGKLKNKRVVCLDIPDRYEFMDAELVALLKAKAGAFLD